MYSIEVIYLSSMFCIRLFTYIIYTLTLIVYSMYLAHCLVSCLFKYDGFLQCIILYIIFRDSTALSKSFIYDYFHER